jgi:hypothetical protein
MQVVRGPGTEKVNMLELGPLHSKVTAHIQRIIEDPAILINEGAGYEAGSMDKKPWHTPEAVKAVLKLSQSLPHIKPVLVAFFKGALTTWESFTSEFEEGSLIHSTTAEERDRAWMPPTNDVNEGALGAFRSYLHKKPNTRMLQYNALAKFKFSRTAAFVHQEFNSDDYAFVHKLAQEMDASQLRKKQDAELIAFRDRQVAERRAKLLSKAQRQAEKEAMLASVVLSKNAEEVTVDMMTVKALDNQLETIQEVGA